MHSTSRARLSTRLLLIATATAGMFVAACGASAGSGSAGAAALGATSSPAASTQPSGESPGAFHLTKTCNGFSCVVSSTSLAAIPVGTSITYSGSPDALVAVIHGPGGTATGTCNIAVSPGSCTFETGTASLAQFHLAVAVTTDAAGVWHWDGTYSFGPGS